MTNKQKNKKKQRIDAELDSKPNTKFFQYYRQSDCISKSTMQTTQTKNKYFIELSNISSFTNDIVYCCLLFVPSVLVQSSDKKVQTRQPRSQFNTIFKFACKAYFLQSMIQREKQKRTNLGVNPEQFVNQESLNKHSIEKIDDYKDKLKRVLKDSQKWAKNKLLLLKQSSKQDEKNNSSSRGDDNQTETHKISTIAQVQRLLIAQTVDVIMRDSQQRKNYIPKDFNTTQEDAKNYLQKMLNNLYQLQFVKIELKKQKFEHFVQNQYSEYLRTSYGNLKKGIKRAYDLKIPYTGTIMIRRYTNKRKGEVIINLFHLIKIRSKEHNYDKEYFEILKRLMYELKQHNKLSKNHYPLLNPQSVMLNQLSLQVQLRYDNILQQALGLLTRPKNLQRVICFQPTPQTFDSFAAPIQFIAENKIKITHFLYGADKYANIEPQGAQVFSSKDKLQLMKQSEMWRYMMTASFVMNQKQYYDEENYASPYVRKNYQNFTKQVQAKLKASPFFYKQVLGEAFITQLNKQKIGDLPQYDKQKGVFFFESLFNMDGNDYSIVKNFQFSNLKKRQNIYYQYFRKMLQMFQDKTYFSKITNSVKYLVRFYYNLYMNFSIILQFCRYYSQKQYAKGILLQRQLSLRLNLVKAEERKMGYIEQSITKYREYETRQKGPLEIIIRNFNEEYKQMDKMNQLYQRLINDLTELDIDKSKKDKRQMVKFFVENIQKNCETVGLKLPVIKRYCKNILNKQFIRYLKVKETQITKQPQQVQNKVASVSIKIFIQKMELISDILLLKQQDYQNHFFTIETVFSPIILAEQNFQKTIKPEDTQMKIKQQKLQTLQYLKYSMQGITTKD